MCVLCVVMICVFFFWILVCTTCSVYRILQRTPYTVYEIVCTVFTHTYIHMRILIHTYTHICIHIPYMRSSVPLFSEYVWCLSVKIAHCHIRTHTDTHGHTHTHAHTHTKQFWPGNHHPLSGHRENCTSGSVSAFFFSCARPVWACNVCADSRCRDMRSQAPMPLLVLH